MGVCRCIYVCMYVCVCIYLYACLCAYVYVDGWVCMYVVCVYMYVCVHVCECTCMCACVCCSYACVWLWDLLSTSVPLSNLLDPPLIGEQCRITLARNALPTCIHARTIPCIFWPVPQLEQHLTRCALFQCLVVYQLCGVGSLHSNRLGNYPVYIPPQ